MMDKKNSAQLAVADPAQGNWSGDLAGILIAYVSSLSIDQYSPIVLTDIKARHGMDNVPLSTQSGRLSFSFMLV